MAGAFVYDGIKNTQTLAENCRLRIFKLPKNLVTYSV
jgi:hypothetical protein